MSKKRFYLFITLWIVFLFILFSLVESQLILAGVCIGGVILSKIFKSKINENVDDERAVRISEKAGKMTFLIFIITGATGGLVLNNINISTKMSIIVNTITSCVCILTVLYVIIFFIYKKIY